MSRDSSGFELAYFDDAPPLTIDPAIFSRNLAALSSEQPALEQQLRNVALPVTWRPVLALDDWPTWRCEAPGEPANWLCDTAVPRTRADALLSIYQPGELNATLPAIACGAELVLLLDRLPRHKAVFVFERDIAVLSAVLRVIDVSSDVAAGRCILLHSDDPAEALHAVLQRWPALLPPGNILLLPGLGEESITALRGIVEKSATERLSEQNRRLEAYTGRAAQPVSSEMGGLGLYCGLPQRGAAHILDAIEFAARAAGVRAVSSFAVRGPRDVHPLAAAGWLTEFRPAVTICIGHRASLVPGSIAGTVCQFLWSANDSAPPAVESRVRTFVASEAVAQRLSQIVREGTPHPVDLMLFAADERLLAEESGLADTCTIESICLVADRPLDDEQSLERMQPTHQVLWKQLRNSVRTAWRAAEPLAGEALLGDAQRVTGLQIGDDSIRELFIDAIERVLIPAVICESAMESAREYGLSVYGVGGGWSDVEGVVHLGDDIVTAFHEIGRIRAQSSRVLAIFPYQVDPWPAALLNFLIAGIPAVVYADGRLLRCAAERALIVGQDLRGYTGLSELLSVIRSAAQTPVELFRVAESGQSAVRSRHTWRNRLEMLRPLIQTE